MRQRILSCIIGLKKQLSIRYNNHAKATRGKSVQIWKRSAVCYRSTLTYDTVKRKVYDVLIDNKLRAEIALAGGNLLIALPLIRKLEDEQYHGKRVYVEYRDTHNFLHSLEDGLAELWSYPDDYPDYHYDFAPSPEPQAFRYTENYALEE